MKSDVIAFDVLRGDHFVDNDGTVIVTIKIDCCDARRFLAVSPDAGSHLFVAPVVGVEYPSEPLHFAPPYQRQAIALLDSDFFDQPGSWDAAGTDEDFRAWIRAQKCWLRRMPGHVCSGDVVAAHVRRISRGAGVAIKPTFSALPLCDGGHTQQHNHGESAIGGKGRVERASTAYVRRWCMVAIVAVLNYENLSSVPPNKLKTWARDRSVFHLLPSEYRRAAP
jgi:hypothetical protein